jgi:hypothetical protein
MPIAASELSERMKLGWSDVAKEWVPGVGTERHDACEPGIDVTELDRTNQSGEVSAERADGCVTFWLRFHRDDEEDCGARKGCEHGLRKWNLIRFVDHRHLSCLDLE